MNTLAGNDDITFDVEAVTDSGQQYAQSHLADMMQ
jgi:hypothetical protein